MFLKIIRLISVCAIALYLYEIGYNDAVAGSYFHQFVYLTTYTKFEKFRHMNILRYHFFRFTSLFAFVMPLIQYLAIFTIPILVYTRAFVMIKWIRPVAILHPDYTRWYLVLQEKSAIERITEEANYIDDLLFVFSLVGLLLILFRIAFSKSAVLDIFRSCQKIIQQ